MALDPQIQALEDNLPNGLALPIGDPVAARETFRSLNVALRDAQPPTTLASIEDLEVPGARGPLPARIYRPAAEGDTATILWIHGGGFVIGDVDAYDFQARTLAERTGATVIAVDYGLAPEDPFPNGADDAEAAARWVLSNVDRLGGDAERVAIAGDSAGGNLSAVTTQALRDESPGFKAQLLLYPVVDVSREYPSHTENAAGPVLTLESALWFGGLYLTDPGSQSSDPRASPLLGELAGLPPAIVVTAQYDPLRDEGVAYADALKAAGVPVTHLHYDALMHGFFGFGPLSAACEAAIDEICVQFKQLIA